MERVDSNQKIVGIIPKETFSVVETVDEAIKAYHDPELPAPDVGALSIDDFDILLEKIRPFEPKPLVSAMRLSLTLAGGAYRALRGITAIF